MEPRKMRRYSLGGTIFLLLIIAFIILGIVLWISGGSLLKARVNGSSRQELPIEGIHSLRIDYVRGQVVLRGTDAEEIAVIEERTVEAEDVSYIEENGLLTIRAEDEENSWLNIDFWQDPSTLTVEVPKELMANFELVEILTGSGDITTEAIKGSEIRLATSSGDIHEVTLEAPSVSLSTSSGDIGQAMASGGNLVLSTSSGDVSEVDLKGEDIRIHTASGTIEEFDLTAEVIHLTTSSGNLREGRITGADAVFANTSSGSIKDIELSAERIELTTTSGDIRTDLDSVSTRLKASSGNIEVSFSEGMSWAAIQSSSGNIEAYTPDNVDIMAGHDALQEDQADPARKTLAVASTTGEIMINGLDFRDIMDDLDWD